MTSPPLVYRWRTLYDDCGEVVEAMAPIGRFARQAHAQFEPDASYFLGEVEERSEVSHRHEFVWLRDAWRSLPDALAAEYPSAEHLRKKALINTGWCDIKDYPCANRAEAGRLRAVLRGVLDEYAIIDVRDAVVRTIQAKSQKRGRMSPADFQASKTAILEWVAALLEVEPRALAKADAA